MSYASWRKCDFQLHSLRDRNWQQSRSDDDLQPKERSDLPPASEMALVRSRKNWAKFFVQACIDKGIRAVALTDHHETVMVPYVQEELAQRVMDDPTVDIWFFPGMELTAKGRTQCLILFDPDLPAVWHQHAQSALGIEPQTNHQSETSSPNPEPLKHAFPDIATRLDESPELRGKYIVLPNMSERSKHSVLRNEARQDFQRMTYVGGYLDDCKTFDDCRASNRNKMLGRDSNWSSRAVYPIPTSDCRSEDFSTLGENHTWIKLAEPTTESIRQAFLAHESRIRTGHEPDTPCISISCLEIQNSTIFGSATLDLSYEMNSLIGGRGSGKSTLLEYLAFGLGRSSYDFEGQRNRTSSRMKDLIQDTLIGNKGSVRLTVLMEAAEFVIVRCNETSYKPVIRYRNKEAETITAKQLRDWLPAVVYGQGDLANIGRETSEKVQTPHLLQFVEADYKQRDEQLLRHISDAKSQIRKAIQNLTSTWPIRMRQRHLEVERKGIQDQLVAMEDSIIGLSGPDQETLQEFERFNQFQLRQAKAKRIADSIQQEIEVEDMPASIAIDFGRELVSDSAESVRAQYKVLHQTYRQAKRQMRVAIKQALKKYEKAVLAWDATYAVARSKREEILQQVGNNEIVMKQMQELQNRNHAIDQELGELAMKFREFGDVELEFRGTIDSLHMANQNRIDHARQWVQRIEELSGGRVKAVVHCDGDWSEIESALEKLAHGTGSQHGARLSRLEKCVAAHGILDTLRAIQKEVHAQLRWSRMGSAINESKPEATLLYSILGGTDGIRTALDRKLDDGALEVIATAIPNPQISLYFCDGETELAFEKASEGQRSAALLNMLLSQTGGPLIIDQPEDDLDNKIISDIAKSLHHAKQKRQLVFASHNANIVVNGSSEMVAHLLIDDGGRRCVNERGAIDIEAIRVAITSVIEGGEKAFKDRQQKYGF